MRVGGVNMFLQCFETSRYDYTAGFDLCFGIDFTVYFALL